MFNTVDRTSEHQRSGIENPRSGIIEPYSTGFKGNETQAYSTK